MHFVTFLHDGIERPGVLVGDEVATLPERFTTMASVVAAEPQARELGPTVPLSSVTLRAPVMPHKNVFCVGRNYLGHAEESARAGGTELKLPSVPTFFTKAPTSIAAPGATLHLSPEVSQKYDWEAELAVVIGKRCRDVHEEDALSVVFGYTCLNDVTARDLQSAHLQWFKGKSLDDACPIGPWIVSADEIPDPQSLRIALRLNGTVKQDGNTASMIFSVAKIIASLSRGMTLEPGDVIATGTPDGVGFARTPPEFLADGDVMDVEIERIGVLRNIVSLQA
ncbi:MAG TPA: fumarylacetoacetate hydrolase family protein [Candidatus Acidoferrales bacterium]|nr:fumarylacetoacetate hydrolase family protein [Candidatus Acidoferrales bacterium]